MIGTCSELFMHWWCSCGRPHTLRILNLIRKIFRGKSQWIAAVNQQRVSTLHVTTGICTNEHSQVNSSETTLRKQHQHYLQSISNNNNNYLTECILVIVGLDVKFENDISYQTWLLLMRDRNSETEDSLSDITEAQHSGNGQCKIIACKKIPRNSLGLTPIRSPS